MPSHPEEAIPSHSEPTVLKSTPIHTVWATLSHMEQPTLSSKVELFLSNMVQAILSDMAPVAPTHMAEVPLSNMVELSTGNTEQATLIPSRPLQDRPIWPILVQGVIMALLIHTSQASRRILASVVIPHISRSPSVRSDHPRALQSYSPPTRPTETSMATTAARTEAVAHHQPQLKNLVGEWPDMETQANTR
jgi:hypothetical protein